MLPSCVVFDVISGDFDEDEPASFIQLLQSDPVFPVNGRLAKRNNDSVVAGRICFEMLRMDRNNSRVLK